MSWTQRGYPNIQRARMNKLLPVIALVSLTLLGCPKAADTAPTGTDEERLEVYASRLEEMRVRAQARDLSCGDTCKLSRDVCDMAKQVCDIAARNPDRGQDLCVVASEDCARANDSCASCSR